MKLIKIISHLSVLALFVFNTQEPVLARSWFHPLNLAEKEATFNIPTKYSFAQSNHLDESENAANISWRDFFADPYLVHLIETALSNNQELNIFLQDIEIAKSEVK